MKHPHQIWEQLCKGEQAALSDLFRLYYGDLQYYGQQFFGDATIVEDKIQEIFLRLWEKHNRLPKTDNILGYLIRSLRNALIDESRKQESQQKFINHLEWLTVRINEEENLERIEKRKQLQIALSQLNEEQREIIFLRFYNQLPYKEIAEIVDIKCQSVRNTVYRAMKILRATMIEKV